MVMGIHVHGQELCSLLQELYDTLTDCVKDDPIKVAVPSNHGVSEGKPTNLMIHIDTY